MNFKALKQEVVELLEEDAKSDKLKSLPLYSCRITAWKFVCSKCYDMVYKHMLVQRPWRNDEPKVFFSIPTGQLLCSKSTARRSQTFYRGFQHI